MAEENVNLPTSVSLFKDGRFMQSVVGSYLNVIKPTLANWDGDWTEGNLDSTWWYDGAQALKREACPATLAGTTLHAVPPGSVIMIEGQRYECPEGGDVKLSFQYAGAYKVWVVLWPYMEGEYDVDYSPSNQ